MVAHPRFWGVLFLTVVVTAGVQAAYMASEAGQAALLDGIEAQLRTARAQGNEIPPETYQNLVRLTQVMGYASAASTLVLWPVVLAGVTAVLKGLFNALSGVQATFRQAFAVTVHSNIVTTVAGLFVTALMYASGDLSSPTRLAVFFPNLPEESFTFYLLTALDLLWVWWLISLSIGLAVLYRQRTGPIATMLLALYGVVALLIAAVRAF